MSNSTTSFFASQKDDPCGVSDHTHLTLVKTIKDVLLAEGQAELARFPVTEETYEYSAYHLHNNALIALTASVNAVVSGWINEDNGEYHLEGLRNSKDRTRDLIKSTLRPLFDSYVDFCEAAIQGNDGEEHFSAVRYALVKACGSDQVLYQTVYVKTGKMAQEIDELIKKASGVSDRVELLCHVLANHSASGADLQSYEATLDRIETTCLSAMGRTTRTTADTLKSVQSASDEAETLRHDLTELCKTAGAPLVGYRLLSKRSCKSCDFEAKPRKDIWQSMGTS